MGKKFKVTIENLETNDIVENEVDLLIFSGIVKGDDGINRSVITNVSGSYLDLCRAYTMLGSIINSIIVPLIPEEKSND